MLVLMESALDFGGGTCGDVNGVGGAILIRHGLTHAFRGLEFVGMTPEMRGDFPTIRPGYVHLFLVELFECQGESGTLSCRTGGSLVFLSVGMHGHPRFLR